MIYDRASTAVESCEQRQSILRFNTPDINKKQRKKSRRNTPIVRRKSSFTIHRKCVKLQVDEYHLKAENSKKKKAAVKIREFHQRRDFVFFFGDDDELKAEKCLQVAERMKEEC